MELNVCKNFSLTIFFWISKIIFFAGSRGLSFSFENGSAFASLIKKPRSLEGTKDNLPKCCSSNVIFCRFMKIVLESFLEMGTYCGFDFEINSLILKNKFPSKHFYY